ncbi:hypothetical protein HYT53_06030 [Candidatus Woesearchaeota archaeon]|nr:hypothetical protein [Candidatus Woesearchaeota archaeon]
MHKTSEKFDQLDKKEKQETTIKDISKKLSKLTFDFDTIKKPWYKDKKIIIPLVITIIFSILISFFITQYYSKKEDQMLSEIDTKLDLVRSLIPEITFEQFRSFQLDPTNPQVLEILKEKKQKCKEETIAKLSSLIGKGILEDITDKSELIKQCDLLKIRNEGLFSSPNQTFLFIINTKKYDFNARKEFIMDIGDSEIKDRFSLFIDEYDFLVWKLYQTDYNTIELKYNISRYRNNNTLIWVFLVWSDIGNLTMSIYDKRGSLEKEGGLVNIKVEKFKLNVSSNDMYLGSDINGFYRTDSSSFYKQN